MANKGTEVLSVDKTTLLINGTPITNMMVGDMITVSYNNERVSHANSVDGVVRTLRADRDEGTLTVIVLKNSETDIYLNNLDNTGVALSGTMTTSILAGDTERIDSYIFEGGSIMQPEVSPENGQTPASSVTYTMLFRKIVRLN